MKLGEPQKARVCRSSPGVCGHRLSPALTPAEHTHLPRCKGGFGVSLGILFGDSGGPWLQRVSRACGTELRTRRSAGGATRSMATRQLKVNPSR